MVWQVLQMVQQGGMIGVAPGAAGKIAKRQARRQEKSSNQAEQEAVQARGEQANGNGEAGGRLKEYDCGRGPESHHGLCGWTLVLFFAELFPKKLLYILKVFHKIVESFSIFENVNWSSQ